MLCDLCKSIPLRNLPMLPDEYDPYTTGWIYPLFGNDQEPAFQSPGFRYWQNVETLQNSASQCDLCSLIFTSVEKVIKVWDSVTEERLLDCSVRPHRPTFEMQIWQRAIGDGLWVLTKTEDPGELQMVAAVGFSVKEGDPLEPFWVGRPIEEYSGSQIALSRAANWLKQCGTHPNCDQSVKPFPTRIIDLGDSTDLKCIKLCEKNGESGSYVCLSYCWGKSPNFTTTKETIESRKKGMSFEEIPKTLQDAIIVTKALGFRYIWIDCLCICQDDAEDWNREAAMMESVYNNAELTIAATLAQDTSVGCFANRIPKRYISIDYTSPEGISGQLLASLQPLVPETIYMPYLEIQGNPLVGRAWAKQERLLSRRILHFEKYQMYFECNHGLQNESGLFINQRYSPLANLTAHDEKVDQDGIFKQWDNFLYTYCSLDLTNSSDRLPALAGITRLFGERVKDQYLAGLWRKILVKTLYWTVYKRQRLSYYRAPSWSWASMDGAPDIGILLRSSENIEILTLIIDCYIELKGSNPYGEVKSGWIKLQAPLQPFFLTGHYNPGPWGRFRNKYVMIRTEEGDPKGCEAEFDFQFAVETVREDGSTVLTCPENMKIFALVLTKQFSPHSTEQDEDRKSGYCCLIVSPIENGSLTMRRLGRFWVDDEVMGDCKYLDPSVQRPIVTLV